ncbi:MAG: nodulation protein NfeD [Thermoplasmata archaeon]|nr:nodulation protein NfeD [Thermoplasmata archaeon]
MSSDRARVTRRIVLIGLAILVASTVLPSALAQGPRVLLAVVDGAIDRSTVDYLQEAVAEARGGGYAALMIRFDTPGGGLAETVAIAEMFNNARDVPILGWVGPVGAHAWSAGTILLVSTDLAAMAPGTTIGSVQPVEVGPGGVVPVTDPKIINAVVTAISEELALHNRPIDLASRFVIDNLNVNATQAQSLRATELVAQSPEEFASLASGRRVVVQSNGTVYKDFTLNTAGAEIVTFSSSSRVRLLQVLSDPLVSSLLLILGIYLVIFGISAPGHGAEIAGIIVLLLALIGLGFSVDPIALLLFIVGVVLIIIEVKTPGHGIFGIGGIVAIILAAAFLAPLRPPRFVVSPDYQLYFLAALLTPTGLFGGFLLFAMYKVQQVRHRTPIVGSMIGLPAVVKDELRPGVKGYVIHRGELWQAISSETLAPDSKVYIHAVDGIVLRVSSAPPTAASPEHPARNWIMSLLRRKAA